MNYGFEIDPRDVLGLSSEASLAEIHEAFRAKSKKHHPDVGGDEWAFRMVTRSYEILSSQRVLHRFSAAERAEVAPDLIRPQPQSPNAGQATAQREGEWVRKGVEDAQLPADKLVDVELFTLRYELDSPLEFLQAPENRNLSCCMTLTWPSPERPEIDPKSKESAATLKVLVKLFGSMPRKSRAVSSWSRVTDGRFVGWLNYPTAIQAYQAFEYLHESLLAKGLGTKQRTREMFLSRDGLL